MNDDIKKALADERRKTFGEFPNGRLNPQDQGAAALAVHVEQGCVRVDFGELTKWFAMPPEQTLHFAEVLTKHANSILEQRKGGGA